MDIITLWGIGVAVGVLTGFIFAQLTKNATSKTTAVFYMISIAIGVATTFIAVYIDIVPETTRDKWIILLFGWMQFIYFYFAKLLIGTGGSEGRGALTQYLVMSAVVIGVSALLLIDYDENWWEIIQTFIPSIAIAGGGVVLFRFGGVKLFFMSILFAVIVGILTYYVGDVATSLGTIGSFLTLASIGGKNSINEKKCIASGKTWDEKKRMCN